jgi:hypothetical protein
MKMTLLCLLFLSGFGQAEESAKLPLELNTLSTVGVGSRTFTGVKVVSSDAVGVKIMHEGGTSRIAYDKLPPDLRKLFSVDKAAADAQLRKEAEQNAAHDRAVEDGMKTSVKEGAIPITGEGAPSLVSGAPEEEAQDELINRLLREDRPDGTGRTRAEIITGLKGYIGQLDLEIKKLDDRMQRRDEQNARKSTNNFGSERGQDRMAKQHEKYNAVRRAVFKRLEEAKRDLDKLEEGE